MMHNTPSQYGSSTIPPKKAKQTKVCPTLHSPLANFALGVLFGFCIGYAFAYLDYESEANFILCNSTKVMKSKHLELTSGITLFLQLVEEVDESLLPYSEETIHQLSNNIQKAITDLKDLRESTKPKIRRRPPLEIWNSNPTLEEKWCYMQQHAMTLSPCADT